MATKHGTQELPQPMARNSFCLPGRIYAVLLDLFRFISPCLSIGAESSSSTSPSSNDSEDEDEDEDSFIDSDEDLSSQPEKYLIFTTGSKTNVPHQIGEKYDV